MYKAFIIAAIVAYVEARFDQEQIPVAAIAALSSFGQPGQAATLAGQVPGSLLAAASSCAKLELADQIVQELGTDAQVIAAAAGLVSAENNFNPFTTATAKACDNASLPATEALRGILALFDPSVVGSDVENANSATSLTTPFDATGLSQAAVMAANGFTNFTLQSNGQPGSTLAAGGAAAAAAPAAAAPVAVSAAPAAAANCANAAPAAAASAAAAPAAAAPAASASVDAVSAPNDADQPVGNSTSALPNGSSVAGVDFGLCRPTMDFELGRPGRKATEGTFLPVDPLVAKGQEDALNPNIITKRICDQLTNVCEANAAAKALCQTALTTVEGLTAKDETTADAFNQALGFAAP